MTPDFDSVSGYRTFQRHAGGSGPKPAEAWTGQEWVPGTVSEWIRDPTGWSGFFWPARGRDYRVEPHGWLAAQLVRAPAGDPS